MANEEGDITKGLLKLSGMLNRHRMLFGLIFLLIYVLTLTPFLILLIKYHNTVGLHPCEICFNMTTAGSYINASLTNITRNLTLLA